MSPGMINKSELVLMTQHLEPDILLEIFGGWSIGNPERTGIVFPSLFLQTQWNKSITVN